MIRNRPLPRLLGIGGLALAAVALVACQGSAAPIDAAQVSAQVENAELAQNGIRVGDGPVEVVLFGDAACPHCMVLDDAIGDELAERLDAGEITLVLHPMNYVSGKRGDTTDYSTRSAALLFAAADAGEEDAVPALYGLIQAHQVDENGAPTDEDLLAFADQAGVDADLSPALSGDDYAALAQAANDYWLGREIPGTGVQLQFVPSVAIDGEWFPVQEDGSDLPRLQESVDGALTG